MSSKKNKETERIAQVEQLLGYSFNNKTLVKYALTHPSAVEGDSALSYQRLEFLGDSVIGFIVAEYAYQEFPELSEGLLTKMRIAVVNGEFLSEKLIELGIDKYIIYGPSERNANARGHLAAAENVFEALAAALYLDAGIDYAREWILSQISCFINPSVAEGTESPKSILQEAAQALKKTVRYRVSARSGPPHSPTFEVEALIEGKVAGKGQGSSKKIAEINAAEKALFTLTCDDKLKD